MASEEPQHQSRVLTIEGGDFTSPIVARFTEEMRRTGRFRFFGLGFERASGRGFDRDRRELFEHLNFFPAAPATPRSLLDVLTMAADLAASPAPPPPLRGDPAGWKGYAARRVFWGRMSRRIRPLLGGYDLYHWHCFIPDYLPVLDWLPAGARLLITFWGSDLFRTTGGGEYARQVRALSRATLFTMASLEMRELFLSKFGRQFYPRLRVLSYGADYLAEVDRAAGSRCTFLKNAGISPDTITVAVAQNGGPENQHLPVIEQIGRLPAELKGNVTVLLPMTYGCTAEYLNAVRAAADRTGTGYRIFESYMSAAEVAELRAATDIAIHVPISDQFSAAMCEALAAGAVLITGAWLQYSRLRLNDVYFNEIGDIGDLAPKLAAILKNYPAEKARTAGASRILHSLMDWQELIPRWAALYNEVLAGGRAL